MLKRRDLYFINSRDQYRLLKKDVTWDEVFQIITEFLKEHNFAHYYTRTWMTDEGVMLDVGSHTEFFLWGDRHD